MTLIVGLIYLAEITPAGPYRWVAIVAAVSLVTAHRSATDDVGDGFRPTRYLAALAIGAAAIAVGSPALGICALLLLSTRAGHHRISLAAMSAIGIHIVWWRYLAAFPLRDLPAALASATSWLISPLAFITPTGLIVQGQSISWSSLPLATAVIPVLAVALTAARQPGQIVKYAASAIGIVAGLTAVVVLLALSGHIHFTETPWWPALAVAVGVTATAWVKPGRPALEPRWGLWLVGSIVLGLILGVGFSPNRAPLRIAFDEGHGEWETTRGTFQRDLYGRTTTYNYVLLAHWLSTKHKVSALEGGWSQIDSDVLIVKMPTKFYGAEEKAAIERFVRAGGLLIVIGDHTNLYGTALVINDLLGTYGLEIEPNATVPLDGDHYDFAPSWWQRTRYMTGIQEVQFQTAATIVARSPFVVPLIVGDRVVGEDAEYSNDRFFGDLHPGVEDRQAPLVVAAERRLGAGRILLFGDSTIFSSFSVMAPGNADLFQNFLEQGTVFRSKWRTVFAAGAALVFLFLAGRERWALALNAVVLVAAVGAVAGRAAVPLERYPATWIEIDNTHSKIELRADTRNAHGAAFDDYSTFFAWVGRTGVLPRMSRDPYADPRTAAMLINPQKSFTILELDAIESYVKLGGRLLVMDDIRFASRSTAGALLTRLGIDLRPIISREKLFDAGPPELSSNMLGLPFDLLGMGPRHVESERASGTQTKVTAIGATPLLVDSDGNVVAAEKKLGRGRVVVFLQSAAFSDFVMGDVWGGDDPSPAQRRLYQLEFGLIDRMTASRPQ